jgi:hypothetical protein
MPYMPYDYHDLYLNIYSKRIGNDEQSTFGMVEVEEMCVDVVVPADMHTLHRFCFWMSCGGGIRIRAFLGLGFECGRFHIFIHISAAAGSTPRTGVGSYVRV